MASEPRAPLEVVRAYVEQLDSGEDSETRALKVRLPTITSFEKLQEMWWNTPPGSRPEQLIVERMAEILSTVDSFEELQEMWGNTPSDSRPDQLIEQRMAEILPGLLPIINSFEKLQEIWWNTSSGSRPRQLIEKRMAEIVQALTPEGKIPKWFLDLVAEPTDIPRFLKPCVDQKAREIVSQAEESVPIA